MTISIFVFVRQFVDSKVSNSSAVYQWKCLHPLSESSYHFKDQASINVVKKRFTDLSLKVKTTIQPVFISRKLNEDLKVREVKAASVNLQYIV